MRIGCAALVGAAVLGLAPARADDAKDTLPGSRAESRLDGQELPPSARAAIKRGLHWLAGRQRADGAFGDAGLTPGEPPEYALAATGLAGLAFLAEGSVPGRGPHGGEVRLALDYVLRESRATVQGYLGDQGRMYSHGFATLFLAEALGASGDPKLEARIADALDRALRLIEATQEENGGWWYEPNRQSGDEGADISVTICQVMALRAAQAAGRRVSQATIARAVAVVKAAADADGHFAYRVRHGDRRDNRLQAPRTAAGVCLLFLLGEYDAPELRRGLGWLDHQLADGSLEGLDERFYYYAAYYATFAFYQWGGDPWARHFPRLRDSLLTRQTDEGGWRPMPIGNEGGVVASAMALIALQVPYRLLPILQR